MVCSNCGFNNPEGSCNCGQCGYPIYQSRNNFYGYDPAVALKISAAKEEISSAKTMGLVALILSLTASAIIGLVLGIIAKNKYKSAMATFPNLPDANTAKKYANAAVTISIIRFAIAIIGTIVAIVVNVLYGYYIFGEII